MPYFVANSQLLHVEGLFSSVVEPINGKFFNFDHRITVLEFQNNLWG
jgi:hypothetical protein